MQDSTSIDLDSAADATMFHLKASVDWEKLAMDGSCKIISFTRSDLTVLVEIERLCYQVLMLVDDKLEMDTLEYSTRLTAAWVSMEQKFLSRNLRTFSKRSK
jgi:hypothetical protein